MIPISVKKILLKIHNLFHRTYNLAKKVKKKKEVIIETK